jgi:hypothetical protein
MPLSVLLTGIDPMRIGPFVIVAALLTASGALASDVRILSLPETVVGAWAPNADACRGSAPGKIDITATQHSDPETSCTISWITVTASRDGPVYSARSVCTRTRTGAKDQPSYLVVTPLANNRLLVRIADNSDDGKLSTYQKCP